MTAFQFQVQLALFILLINANIIWTASVRRSFQSAAQNVHMIVFDAGSTGTRLNYYEFQRRQDDEFPKIEMVSSTSYKTKPGISSFKNDPSKAFDSIDELITKANLTKDGSPLLVKATAGMRILDIDNHTQADAIMQAIYDGLVKKYAADFNITRDNIGIFPGVDEGSYAYLAIEFLNSKEKDFLGHLDLGGASTQITFDHNQVPSAIINTADLDLLSGFGRNYDLYSKSYLWVGLEAQRFSAVGSEVRCYYTECTSEADPTYTTPCLHPEFKDIVKVGSGAIKVAGQAGVEANDRYRLCAETVLKSIKNISPIGNGQTVFADTVNKKFFLLHAGFYHVLKLAGAIHSEPDNVQLYDTIQDHANSSCRSVTKEGKYEPYQCFDLTFITKLLMDGYKFSPQEVFYVTNEVNGQKIGWSLGLASKEAYKLIVNN